MSATPVLRMADACDCHMHVYDRRYPFAPQATLTPADASVEDYREVQRRLGTSRTIVVTPSTYGASNACTIAALDQLRANARGVAVVDRHVTDAELARLHRAGIRGIRFNLTLPAPVGRDDLPALAARVGALGWHVQLNLPSAWLPEMRGQLARLGAPIVFDHYGHLPLDHPEAEPSFRAIAELLCGGKAWVKLSGPYLESRTGPPDFADMRPLATRYLSLAPERVVWGSDWPHPTQRAKGVTDLDDAALLRTWLAWCGSPVLARRVLVDNPAALYGFTDADAGPNPT
ncbi:MULTISPECIES: amidohydrolase family protein [unclassified Cupriavidus]|uniref:amidohydrolase family protein n=1 Tax=Cupriavidus sp. H19C3 TaxID=3241603 RepID=UPI003BF8E9C6